MAVHFKGSRSHTIGIELEIQLVDSSNFALVPTSSNIIGKLKV